MQSQVEEKPEPGPGALERSDFYRLRHAFDTIPAMVHSAQPDGSCDYFNQRWLDYLGVSLDDIKGWKWTSRIHPEDADAFVQKFRSSIRVGEPFEAKARVRRQDGVYRWLLHRKVPLRDEQGKVIRWYGSSIDIDELKQSEFYLTEGQRLSHVGSWTFSSAGFDHWSSELFKIHGLEPSVKPPGLEEYLALVHPEDREYVSQTIQNMFAEGRGFDFTKRIVRPDGEIRRVRCVGIPSTYGGSSHGFVGTGIDVTEQEELTQDLRRREACLAEAERLSHTGSCAWNVITGEQTWSEENYRILGYDRSIKPALELIRNRVHPDDLEVWQQTITRAAEGKVDFEHRLLMPDGSVKHLHVVADGVQKDGKLVEVIGTARDITERKRAEEAIRRSEAYLAEAQKLSHTGSWAWNPITNEVPYWSEESYRIYGFDPAQGIPPFEMTWERVHPEDRDALRAAIERAVREKAPLQIEHRLVLPGGIVRNHRVLAHPVLNASGELIEYLGTVVDVTEQKRAEEERKEHLWFLESMDRINRAMQRTNDVEGMMSGVLEETLAIFGSDRAWLVYPCDPDAATSRVVMEHSRPEYPGAFALGVEVPMDRHAVEFVRRVLDSAGAATDLNLPPEMRERFGIQSAIAIAVRPKGDRPYMFGLHQCSHARDWTAAERRLFEEIARRLEDVLTSVLAHRNLLGSEEELRRSEAYLAEAQKMSHTGSWANAANGEPKYWSEECYRVLGFDSAEPLPSLETIFQRIHPDDRAAMREQLERGIRDKADFEVAMRIVHPITGIRNIRSICHAVLDRSGGLREMVGTVIDVTDRKRREALLAGGNKVLEMVAKGDSLANILDSLCLMVEEQSPDVLACILLMDPNGRQLRHGGAPSLPKVYIEAIDGALIGPAAGSCGTAAYLAQQVIVSDIATDPLWTDFRELALAHALHACWSTPIFSSKGKVIGTFAMYYRQARNPSPRERDTTRHITHLAGVAIERKLAESARRESEAYLAEAQRLSHTGSWAWAPATGEIRYWSEETYRVLGFDLKAGPPRFEIFFQRLCSEDQDRVRELFENAVREKVDFEMDYRIVHPSGEIKDIHAVGHPVCDQAGQLVEFVGTVIDATESKRAEEELRASERKYRHLVDTTPAFVHTALPDGNLDFFNRGWLEYLGLSITDLLGWRWTAAIHPEDVKELLNKWRASLESGQPLVVESRVRRADGEYRWFLHRKQPQRNEAGEIVKWYGSSIEIEERKIAEEAIRRGEAFLAEGQRLSHTGSWGWNASTGKLTWSQEHFRILGLDPRAINPSLDVFWERVHPDDRIGLRRAFESALQEKRNFEQEFRIVTPDWSIRHLHGVGHAVLTKANELVEFIGSTMDITERKRAEERAESQREAMRLALNAFVEELDVNRFLGDAIAELNKQFRAKSWELWLYDEAISALLLHSSSHPTEHFNPAVGSRNARPLEELQGLWPIKDAARAPQILELSSRESLLSQRHGESLKRRGIRTLMIVPLVLGEQNLGFLELHFQSQTQFNSDDLELVQALVNHATLALQLNRLTRRAEKLAVTEERNRLAREIHDTLAQAFAGVVLHSEALGASLAVSKRRSAKALTQIQKLARSGLEEARRSVQALRPKALDGNTLPEALRQAAIRLNDDAKLSCQFRQRGKKIHLSGEIQNELFRIGQEALTNVVKHAQAKSVSITLVAQARRVALSIKDDGVGFATAKPQDQSHGFGMGTMRERALGIGGRLRVESRPGRGTTIRVEVPLSANRSNKKVTL